MLTQRFVSASFCFFEERLSAVFSALFFSAFLTLPDKVAKYGFLPPCCHAQGWQKMVLEMGNCFESQKWPFFIWSISVWTTRVQKTFFFRWCCRKWFSKFIFGFFISIILLCAFEAAFLCSESVVFCVRYKMCTQGHAPFLPLSLHSSPFKKSPRKFTTVWSNVEFEKKTRGEGEPDLLMYGDTVCLPLCCVSHYVSKIAKKICFFFHAASFVVYLMFQALKAIVRNNAQLKCLDLSHSHCEKSGLYELASLRELSCLEVADICWYDPAVSNQHFLMDGETLLRITAGGNLRVWEYLFCSKTKFC